MTLVLGMFHIVVLALGISGFDKLLAPAPAGAALMAARLVPGTGPVRHRTGDLMARTLGLVEVAVASAAFGVPILPAGLEVRAATITATIGVAALFGGFTWFAIRLASIDSSAGCGCFGAASAPPGPLHIVLNLVAIAIGAATSLAVVISNDLPRITIVTSGGLTETLPYLAAVLIGASLFLKGPALLAEVGAARNHGRHNHDQAITFAVSKDWRP